MSSEVQITLSAIDEASSVIEGVGSNLSSTFSDIEGQTQELASTTDSATSQISSDYDKVGASAQNMADTTNTANMSCSDAAMTMNSTAMSGAALFMSFENLPISEVSVDRAHLMVERSTLSLQKAQKTYHAAAGRYGPDSQQAKDAADKLAIAQDALTVSQERLGLAQQNVTNSMISAALTVIPTLVSVINLVSNAEKIWEGIQWALNAAMDANPVTLVVTAIAALVAIIILAWNTCPPFRNALIEIGQVLGGALKVAIEAITVGLTWFWKNVIEPIANFLERYFIVQFETLSSVLTWLWQNILQPLGTFLITVFVRNVEAVSAVANFLWNNVLKPLGDFLEGAFTTAWKDLGAIFEWFYNLVKPIIDAVNGVAKTLGGFVDSVAGAMKGAGKAITDFIGGICFAHALENAANSSDKTMNNWVGTVKTALHKSHAAIKGFNADVTLTGSPSLGATGIGGGSLPSGLQKPTVVNITIPGPLVNIEGSADKATADLASKQVLASLQTIIVEPTSTHAAATQKRIRSGSLFT